MAGSSEPKAVIRDSNFHKSFKHSFIAIEEAVTGAYGGESGPSKGHSEMSVLCQTLDF